MFLYVGSYLLTGVCSPYVVSLCDFAYYVVVVCLPRSMEGMG